MTPLGNVIRLGLNRTKDPLLILKNKISRGSFLCGEIKESHKVV